MALRNNTIVPYFHPENVLLYQDMLQSETANIRSESQILSPRSRSDATKDAEREKSRSLGVESPFREAGVKANGNFITFYKVYLWFSYSSTALESYTVSVSQVRLKIWVSLCTSF